jgi:intracellular septation protein
VTKAPSPGLRVALDYAPLIVFFAVNFIFPAPLAMKLVARTTGFLPGVDRMAALIIARVIVATAAFIVATVIAMVISRIRLGTISPMLWLSGGLVVIFGGLTIYFQNPNFIKMKPTIVYLTLAAVLGFGLATGRPLLQAMLGTAYPGLNAVGWRKLTRNWTAFFVAMAALNEVVWRATAPLPGDNPNVWVAYKLWGAIPLTVLFAIANVPMLLRHGLSDAEPAEQLPPEG